MEPRFQVLRPPGWILIVGTLLAGCNQLGPASIRNGRSLYNRAIIDSGDRQTLEMIARLRYGESVGLLAVSSVTANIRVRATAGADFQAWGNDAEVAGNLVPLSTNFAYEENPTISYTPIDGAAYVRELLSPIPIDLTFLLLGARPDKGMNMVALIESINGVRNPAFVVDPDRHDDRFLAIVDLITELSRVGAVSWARTSPGDRGFSLVISRYAPDYTAAVMELLELVEVSTDALETGRDVILPTWLSDGTTTRQGGLAIKTRSIFDLLTIAGASMDVPPEHVEAGWVKSYPELGAVKSMIRIQCSESAPEAAMVAVEHHGWWYYIDATDSASKESFRLIQTLVSVRIAESAKSDAQLPILTVPVSR